MMIITSNLKLMLYLIFGEKNINLIKLRLAKKNIKNYKIVESFDKAISYFQEHNLTKACFINDNMIFHRQYHEFSIDTKNDLIVLSSDFFTKNLNGVIMTNIAVENYINGTLFDMNYSYYPLLSSDPNNINYELGNYKYNIEIENFYNTYCSNYYNIYLESLLVEYNTLLDFEKNFLTDEFPIVIILKINKLNENEIIQYINSVNKNNTNYHNYRFCIASEINIDYKIDNTIIYNINNLSSILWFQNIINNTCNFEFLYLPTNITFIPDLNKINLIIKIQNKQYVHNTFVIIEPNYFIESKTNLLDNFDISIFSNDTKYELSDIIEILIEYHKSGNLYQEPLMTKLERYLTNREIHKGLYLVNQELNKIKNSNEYHQYLIVKISFLIYLKDYKTLENDIAVAFSVFQKYDEDLLSNIMIVCLSMEKELSENVLKLIYNKILTNELPENKKIIVISKLLSVKSIDITDMFNIVNNLKTITIRNEFFDIVFQLTKRIIIRKFAWEYPDLLIELYNILYDSINILHKLNTIDDYNKMLEINIPEIIYHLCTTFNQYESDPQKVVERRKEISKSLDILLECIDITVPLDEIIRYDIGNFCLSYDGICSKEIFIKKAKLFRKICPELNFIKNTNNKNTIKKIAFISDLLTRRHSVYKDRHMVINYLSHYYDVYIYTFKELDKCVKYTFGNAKHIMLKENLSEMKQEILKGEFDVIVYPEIGMNPFMYFLALMKLAPVQINTWGHSDTSGIDSIDYFISSEYFELPNADDFYSEKLIKLPSLSTCYRNPLSFIDTSKFLTRYQFGFSKNVNIYLCPQSLFKFKPLYDDYLINILKKDNQGILILLDSFEHKQKFIKRIEEKNKNILPKIHFVNSLSHQNFMGLINCCDVMLDTYPFGGCNSSLEAFALGKPVVTQPAKLINGRFTYGFYKKMDISDLIVDNKDDYIKLAVKLGTNKEYNKKMSDKIKEKANCLFLEEKSCIDWKKFIDDLPPSYN